MKYVISDAEFGKKIVIKKTFLDYLFITIFSILVTVFMLPFSLVGASENVLVGVLIELLGIVFAILFGVYLLKRYKAPPIYADPSTKTIQIEDFSITVGEGDKIIVIRTFTWTPRKSSKIYGKPLNVGPGKINVDFSYLGRRRVNWAVIHQASNGVETVIAKIILSGYNLNNFAPAMLAEDLAELFGLPLIDKTGEQAMIKKPGQTDMFIGDKIVQDQVIFPIEDILFSNSGIFTLERDFNKQTILTSNLKPKEKINLILMILASLFLFSFFFFIMGITLYIFLTKRSLNNSSDLFAMVYLVVTLVGFFAFAVYRISKDVNELKYRVKIIISPEKFDVHVKGWMFSLGKKSFELRKIEGVNIIYYWKGYSLEVFSDELRYIFPVGIEEKIANDMRGLLLGILSEYART